jgi:hypothetical protein
MTPGIPQVHLTNNVKMNGHTDLEFTGSSFLVEYNGKTLACAHAQVLSHHFGVKPGVENKKDIPPSVKEWILCPRTHKGGFFGKKPVIENPIRVTKFLNVESPGKILLMDVDALPPAGNYTGMRMSTIEATRGMDIAVATCPKDLKDMTQRFYFGEIVQELKDGHFVIALNDEIPHGSVPGSPVSEVNGKLLGMIVAFQYVEGKLYFFVERTTQLKQDLLALFGEQDEDEEAVTTEASGPFVTITIKISGDGFASPKELDLRAQVENEIEKRNLGRVVEAGSGMGVMEITFAEAHDIEGIRKVLQEFKLSDKAEIRQYN